LFSDALSWGGWGNLFTVNAIGGDLNTPPSLVGQQSFNIYYVAAPEPSTYALLALGGFGLWLCRRRKLPDNNNHDLAPGKES
jgi:hypothetical protein